MIRIYYTNSFQIRQKKALSKLLEDIPEDQHEKAYRYRFDRDAYNFVLGRLLLKKGLGEFGVAQKLEDLVFQENGKPLLPGIFFNISHSDNLVVCIFSTNGAIGIDIEKEKPLELDHFTSSFTEKEWAEINNATFPLQKFYWYWTRKESIIKALGVNLSYLHDIELDSTSSIFMAAGKKWFLKDLNVNEDYWGAVCSETEIPKLDLLYVDEF